jgi:hypothetical protein
MRRAQYESGDRGGQNEMPDSHDGLPCLW